MNIFIKKNLSKLIKLISKPVDSNVFILFRRFFMFKIFLFAIFVDFFPNSLSDINFLFLGIILFLATLNACSLRIYWPGVTIIFFYKLLEIIYHFPYTVNHDFLELFFILLILFSFLIKKYSKTDGTVNNITLISILLVWFFSGIQKVFSGYWLNGEMITYYALYSFHMLGEAMRYIIIFGESIFGTAFEPLPYIWQNNLEITNLLIPFWVTFLFLLISWIFTFGEILLPILAIFYNTRKFAFVSLFIFQIIVGILTGVVSFMFTGLAAILLFFPKKANFKFSLLFILLIFYIIFTEYLVRFFNISFISNFKNTISFLFVIASLVAYYSLNLKRSIERPNIKNFFNKNFLNKLKISLIFCVIIYLIIWPVTHIFLVSSFGFSSWRYGGFGMFATPYPGHTTIEVLSLTNTNLTSSDLIYIESDLRLLEEDIKHFNKEEDILNFANIISNYLFESSRGSLIVMINRPRVNLIKNYAYSDIDVFIYENEVIYDLGNYKTDSIVDQLRLVKILPSNSKLIFSN